MYATDYKDYIVSDGFRVIVNAKNYYYFRGLSIGLGYVKSPKALHCSKSNKTDDIYGGFGRFVFLDSSNSGGYYNASKYGAYYNVEYIASSYWGHFDNLKVMRQVSDIFMIFDSAKAAYFGSSKDSYGYYSNTTVSKNGYGTVGLNHGNTANIAYVDGHAATLNQGLLYKRGIRTVCIGDENGRTSKNF